MFRKFFTKYARAVNDEKERKNLYKLFCARFTAEAVFIAVSFGLLIILLVGEDAIEEQNFAFMAVTAVLLLLWFVAILTAAALWISFNAAYRKILQRKSHGAESPEVAKYRSSAAREKQNFAKSMRWAIALLVIGAVVMIALVAADFIKHPDSEDLTALGYAGIGVFAVCFMAFFLALVMFNVKKERESVMTVDELKAIDESQGEKYRYSVTEDKNALTLKYLFPDEELLKKAEDLSQRRSKTAFIVCIVLLIVGIAASAALFSGRVFDRVLTGYAVPASLTFAVAGTALATLGYTKKLNALEKEQKIRLESVPEYSVNLEIFRKYETFGKRKGKVLPVFLALTVIVGFLLAAAFPAALWSAFSVIVLIAGLALNTAFVGGLRQSVMPLERQVDSMSAAANTSSGTDPVAPSDVQTAADSDMLSGTDSDRR